ncbi:16S rRNA (guanine(527)-N(7))-methyltransferase RsmG [Octadecabacter sp.]|nr:16S rRNA (guanine(527)-N(7))-methyltransferase RsmG [Octadecabacter sp.]
MSEIIANVAGTDVSRETIIKLQSLSDLISKWTKTINLIAPASVEDIWERHIVDSAQLFHLAGENWNHWIDLGSGGGLPGLVIAVLDQKSRPITLVESDTRKCLFLTAVRRQLGLNVVVLNERIETMSANPADILSARALAPLPKLLRYADRYLSPMGRALLPKGEKYQEELDAAHKSWQINYKSHPSVTNPNARILEISRIAFREP